MAENDNTLNNETQIKKKKSFLPVIIAVVIAIIAGVIVYFSFFSNAAIRDREIKAHLASAEKYIDDIDYEKALAEYEAILKLDPSLEDILDDYTETALAWSEDVADDDLEKAMEILDDAIKFLEKNASEKGANDEYIEKLQKKLDKYTSELEDDDSDEADEDDDDSDDADAEVDVDVADYTSEIIDVDGIIGDNCDYWCVTPESIICERNETYYYDPDGTGFESQFYNITIDIYDYSGNLIKELYFNKEENISDEYDGIFSWSMNVLDHYHGNIGMVVCLNREFGCDLYMYDYMGESVGEIYVDPSEIDEIGAWVNVYGGYYATPLHFKETVDDNYLAGVLNPEWCYKDVSIYPEYADIEPGWDVPYCYLKVDTMTFESALDRENLLAITPQYDEEQFLYCSETKYADSEAKYLIETADEQWGYADEDFNILALYEDASTFNVYGYALVSDDREHYDLIDSDFNVVEEDFAQGDSAWTNGSSVMLIVQNGDDRTFYLVKDEKN